MYIVIHNFATVFSGLFFTLTICSIIICELNILNQSEKLYVCISHRMPMTIMQITENQMCTLFFYHLLYFVFTWHTSWQSYTLIWTKHVTYTKLPSFINASVRALLKLRGWYRKMYNHAFILNKLCNITTKPFTHTTITKITDIHISSIAHELSRGVDTSKTLCSIIKSNSYFLPLYVKRLPMLDAHNYRASHVFSLGFWHWNMSQVKTYCSWEI